VKKWLPALAFLVVVLMVICIWYFVRLYQSDAPGKKGTEASPGAEQIQPLWVEKKGVISVEWNGKRISWLLRRISQMDEVAKSAWTLNGKPVTEADTDTILLQMNSLLAKGEGAKRSVSSLKNEAVDSTVTVTSGTEAEEKVYQIASEAAEPNTFWIIPSGASFIYPVSDKDMQLFEKNIGQIKALLPSK
jgi:hypothetical protein